LEAAEGKLFVGMVPKETTEDQLMELFAQVGEVEEVAILRGPQHTSRGLEFSFCSFLPPTKFFFQDVVLSSLETEKTPSWPSKRSMERCLSKFVFFFFFFFFFFR
jgi:RNA recognition motif-containing protein